MERTATAQRSGGKKPRTKNKVEEFFSSLPSLSPLSFALFRQRRRSSLFLFHLPAARLSSPRITKNGLKGEAASSTRAVISASRSFFFRAAPLRPASRSPPRSPRSRSALRLVAPPPAASSAAARRGEGAWPALAVLLVLSPAVSRPPLLCRFVSGCCPLRLPCRFRLVSSASSTRAQAEIRSGRPVHTSTFFPTLSLACSFPHVALLHLLMAPHTRIPTYLHLPISPTRRPFYSPAAADALSGAAALCRHAGPRRPQRHHAQRRCAQHCDGGRQARRRRHGPRHGRRRRGTLHGARPPAWRAHRPVPPFLTTRPLACLQIVKAVSSIAGIKKVLVVKGDFKGQLAGS